MSSGELGNLFGGHFGGHLGAPTDRYQNDCVQTQGAGFLGVDGFPYSGNGYPLLVIGPASEFLEDLHVSIQAEPKAEMLLVSAIGIGTIASNAVVPTAVNSVDLLIRSKDGEVSIDTREMELTTRIWCGDVKVHLWRGDTVVVQAVIRHQADFQDKYAFEDLGIDHRAISFRPISLQDVVVKQGDELVSVVRDDRSIVIAPGYNMRLDGSSLLSERGERISQLLMTAEAGAGLGRFPGCDANVGVTSLGRAVPTPAGDLLMGGIDCLAVKPVIQFTNNVVNVVAGQFQLYDSCSAPCTCEDFASVANYAINTWNQYRVLATRLGSIQSAYHELRDLIVAWRDCAQSNPLRLHVWKAEPCGIGIGAGICNVSETDCLEDQSLTISLGDGAGGTLTATLYTSAVYQTQYAGGLAYNAPTTFTDNGGSSVTIPLNKVSPGQMGFVFVRYDLPEGQCDAAGDVTLELGGTLPEGWNSIDPITVPFDFG